MKSPFSNSFGVVRKVSYSDMFFLIVFPPERLIELTGVLIWKTKHDNSKRVLILKLSSKKWFPLNWYFICLSDRYEPHGNKFFPLKAIDHKFVWVIS